MAKKEKIVKVKTNTQEVSFDPFYTTPFFINYYKETAILFIISFALYHVSISFDYVLDDKIVITDNKFTKEGFGGIYKILTTESFEGYFGEKKELVQGNRYRPLSIVTFAIEYSLCKGLNPEVSHIINIILYGLTCMVLMMVLVMLFRNYKSKFWWFSIPFIAALLFATHPIHTEAVANIKGRDEIMSLLFSLLSLYGGLRYVDAGNNRWLIFSLISYFLGLLSKENAITFLAVIPLTIYFFSNVKSKWFSRLFLWLVLATLVYLILRFNTAGVPKFNQKITDLMNNPFLGMNPIEKAGSIMYTLWKYIALQIFPHPLSHDYYPYAIPKVPLYGFIPLISLAVHAALLYFGVKGIKNKSVIAYSILYYFLTLSIVSNIVINLGTFMNERFIFMASVGFSILSSYLLVHILGQKTQLLKGFLGAVILVPLLVGYCYKTYTRVPVWKDALSLNQSAVQVSGGSARANSFMATALFEKFKNTTDKNQKNKILNRTEAYAQKAVDIVPDYHNANLMLIGVYSERYKINRDINAYIKGMRACILRRPDIKFIQEFSDYLEGKHNDELFTFYLDVGNELLKFSDKRKEWSIKYLEYAYKIDPKNRGINLALANAYELQGKTDVAQQFKIAAGIVQ